MDTWATFPPEPLDHLRPDFDASIKTIAVERFGYSKGDALLKSLNERNRNGRYAVEWVRGAWEGFGLVNAVAGIPLPKHTSIPVEAGLYWYYENGGAPRPVLINQDKLVGKFKSFNGAEQSWLGEGDYLLGPQPAPTSKTESYL